MVFVQSQGLKSGITTWGNHWVKRSKGNNTVNKFEPSGLKPGSNQLFSVYPTYCMHIQRSTYNVIWEIFMRVVVKIWSRDSKCDRPFGDYILEDCHAGRTHMSVSKIYFMHEIVSEIALSVSHSRISSHGGTFLCCKQTKSRNCAVVYLQCIFTYSILAYFE